jgi:hypothetical protein
MMKGSAVSPQRGCLGGAPPAAVPAPRRVRPLLLLPSPVLGPAMLLGLPHSIWGIDENTHLFKRVIPAHPC